MKKRWLSAALLLGVLAGGGCSSVQEPQRHKLGLGTPDGHEKYEKINSAGLYLNMVSKPVLYAGDDGVLVFALRNSSGKTVEIREWFSNEPENVKILIQPYLPDMTAPDPGAWIELVEPEKRPVIHYPMTLMPDNQAMVSKKLEFIRKMEVSPGMERRFFIQGQLALKSLNLTTEVMVLRILPAKVEKKGSKK